MGKTIVEKILSIKSGRQVAHGDIVTSKVDFVMVPDAQGPWVIEVFNKLKNQKVFDKDKIGFIIDHYVPCPNASVAAHHDMIRQFCKEYGTRLYESGEGICHRLMFEKGHIYPGGLFIGADSHSCSYGAVSALGTGIGATDAAVAMHFGELWFKVPHSVKVVLEGELKSYVTVKDVALYITGQLRASGALYDALEYHGSGIAALDMEDRFTICNMAVECGAKFGIMPFDKVTEAWCLDKGLDPSGVVHPDETAVYEKELLINLSDVTCSVARPHKVDAYAPVSDVIGVKVDMVLLGTCTNGSLKDLAVAAGLLREHKSTGKVRFLVVPGSKDVYSEAVKAGYINIFLDHGAMILPPGCGPCCGSSAGVPGDGEVVLSTANRNFLGRMGNIKSDIYLSSPLVCAAAVITGEITNPEDVING
ncbi:MAG: aconitase/3-isopropylmalate dehydratase large subunit family protein [Defluviitaleaceae bacterium]|nr:aconitase/3-isopropylmalate dehydratase large subunit family protein [Defluviitaleaceae bacterium]